MTLKDRRILKTYLDTGMRVSGYTELMLRLRRSHSRLREDLELIDAALRKVEEASR